MPVKKITTLLLFIAILASFFVGSATLAQLSGQAKDGLNVTADQAEISKGDGGTPTIALANFFGRVVNYLFGVIGLIFVTIMLIGGYLWMAARGNEEKVSKAKIFLLNGFFGLLVIFIAYGLVFVIGLSLGGAIGDDKAAQISESN